MLSAYYTMNAVYIHRLRGDVSVESKRGNKGRIFMRTLKLKKAYMQEDMVRVLQTMLNKLGYYAADVDAVFGPITKAAVMTFQKAAKITVDGVVGAKTWEKIYQVTGDKPKTDHFDFDADFNRPHRPELAAYWTPCPVKYYANVQELFFRLETLRSEMNPQQQDIKLLVRSGFRGPKYNKACGGAKGSKHLTGEAADVYAVRTDINGVRETRIPNCYQIGLTCENLFGTGGFGYGSNTNVHVDIRANRTHWWYGFKNWASWKIGQGAAA